MFGILGFLPAFIVANILKKMGMLRVPERVEMAGLDLPESIDAEEYAIEVSEADIAEAKRLGILN